VRHVAARIIIGGMLVWQTIRYESDHHFPDSRVCLAQFGKLVVRQLRQGGDFTATVCNRFVIVEYHHGSPEVPDEFVAAIDHMVARVIVSPAIRFGDHALACAYEFPSEFRPYILSVQVFEDVIYLPAQNPDPF
jgi:hypothetical protein